MDEHAPQANMEQPAPEGPHFARRRLGRGLNALLGSSKQKSAAADDEQLERDEIHVELIEPNPFQPRRDFDPATLGELSESIKQHGVLQPLLVRSDGGRYQLIAGERRWLAAKQAGLETVPCRVLELEDRRVCEVAIEENLKRKDLNVLEKAQAFQDYLDRFDSTVEELARQLSMNRSTVSNYVRLLDLTEPVKQALAAEKITNGHARALLSLKEADQIRLCEEIQAKSLSVRATERAVRSILAPSADDSASADETATIPFPSNEQQPSSTQPSNHVLSLQQQLRDCLGVKVEIQVSGKESGKIIIPFDSNDDFERLLRQLRRAA